MKTERAITGILNIPASPLWGVALTLILIAIYTAFGPAEKSLGTHVRVVYLHGAWVWASLAAFALAGLVGSAGLVTRRQILYRWSQAFGRTGLLFWISYLPLSLWAMQANWNGLFLAEPRWRLAVAFATGGLAMQAGLALIARPALTAAGNLLYIVLLLGILLNTPNVMHPPSPILSSDPGMIQLYFLGLLFLALLTAWQVARWWYGSDPS